MGEGFRITDRRESVPPSTYIIDGESYNIMPQGSIINLGEGVPTYDPESKLTKYSCTDTQLEGGLKRNLAII